MKTRHWVALASLAGAAALLLVRRATALEDSAGWDGTYWVLLGLAAAALLRRRRDKQP